MLPRLLRPQVRKKHPEIEKKISRITDIDRTMVDLYKGARGTQATRETRMEVVAWIAVCEFQCKLEGGFVRDWVVGNHIRRPASPLDHPKAWIQTNINAAGRAIPSIVKDVVPSDLDCHLSLNTYFDVEKFQDKLHKFGITCRVIREDWRYILVIDEEAPTGPFTVDLIEPHVALTHDRIDLDVNNLSLERDFPREIGMRVDITQEPYSIDMETIIGNIQNRRFRVLRPIDKLVQERMNKMIQRGWAQTGEPLSYAPPPPPKYYAVLAPLPVTSTLYQSLLQEMKKISDAIEIVSIEEVKNPLLENIYEANRKQIAKECSGDNPNERKLFHGTRGDGISGILDSGFDDRFFVATGAWGECLRQD